MPELPTTSNGVPAPEGQPGWESADQGPRLPYNVPSATVLEAAPRPESDIDDSRIEEVTPQAAPVLAAAPATQAVPPPVDSLIDLRESEPSPPIVPSVLEQNPTNLPQRRPPGLTTKSAFLLVMAPAVIGCLIGFITSGVIAIPALAGWGLIVGSVAAAIKSPPRLGWAPVWLPPLAMLALIAVLGQVTLLGAMPTLAREVAMIAANLTTTAPAQLISVALAAAIVFARRKLLSR